jgi:sugar transferase (PEP-CTERM/EpsH1 system associated)
LGTFIDDENDLKFSEKLDEWTTSKKVLELTRFTSLLKVAGGFLRGKPLTLPYYERKAMASWVKETVEKYSITKIVVYSSSMVQFVNEYFGNESFEIVVDFVDMDSDKWRQYSEKKLFPLSKIYQREYRLLDRYEFEVSCQVKAVTFVSDEEARHFQTRHPTLVNVDSYSNGVDTSFFDPIRDYENPYLDESKIIAFTGAMDYWANVDAAVWFHNEVFPIILDSLPGCYFAIVGSNPSKEILKLEKHPNVIVTGRVNDIRGYIRHADICVAPLRISRGIQNKVLEAYAMNRPVVLTSAAFEGLTPISNIDQYVSDDACSFAHKCIKFLTAGDTGQPSWMRDYVIDNYGWDACLKRLNRLLEG